MSNKTMLCDRYKLQELRKLLLVYFVFADFFSATTPPKSLKYNNISMLALWVFTLFPNMVRHAVRVVFPQALVV